MKAREFSPQESGSAIVELAFSLPMFLILILGTAEIANIAWASVQLNNAAHAAAQYGSLSRANAADPVDSQTGQGILETAAQREAPSLSITFPTPPVTNCSCIDPSSGSATTPVACTATFITDTSCTSPKVVLASIQVNVQASVAPLVHYPGLPASYTLNGQATMGIAK